MSDHVKLILKSVYFLNNASLERKLFNLVNLLAKGQNLTPLSELDFKNGINFCIGNDYLEYYDFHSHQCGKSALMNQLCCGCGSCGRYYRIKIGALNKFDVQDLMALEGN